MMAQSKPYQNFLDFMNISGGLILEIEFYQEQNGERFESDGTFYYIEKNHYIFDSYDHRLTFKYGELTSLNKLGKQVILDTTVPGDITVFDILTGENDAVETGDAILEKNGYRIPFTLKEWDLKGTIITNHGSGQPKQIIMKIDKYSEIRIRILSAEPLRNKEVGEVDLSEYEIIDLRE
jgi:hypothetical protein